MAQTNDIKFIESLTTMSIESGSVERILAAFADFSEVAVAYIEAAKSTFYISKAPDDFVENIRLYPFEERLRLYTHFPVNHAGTLMGSIVINTNPGIFFPQHEYLPHLANAIKICALLGNSDTSGRRNDETIIALLLSGQKEDTDVCRKWLQHNKIDPDGTCRAVTIYLMNDDTATDRGLVSLHERLKGIAKCFPVQFISCIREKSIILDFLVTDGKLFKSMMDNFAKIAHHQQIGEKDMFRTIIGVGGEAIGYDKFLLSWKQSISAIKYAIANDNSSAISLWSDMGINCNIASTAEQPEYLERCILILRPLLDHDSSHRGNLFYTLVAFTVNQWNLTATAQKLFLHYNSIKYRYNKIATILGLNLDSLKVRFDLTVAVRTYLFSLPIEKFIAIYNNLK